MYVLQEAPSLSVCTDRRRFNTHACALTASWMFVNISKNQGGDKAVVKLEIGISRPLRIPPSKFQMHKIVWGGGGKFSTEPKKGGRYAFLCVKIPRIVFVSLSLESY